jgi:hypothetical protein
MKYLLLLSLLSINEPILAQVADNTNRLNERNIYYQAFKQYLNYVQTEEGRKIDKIYIEDNFRMTDSLLFENGTTKFIKLEFESIPSHLKSNPSLILYRLFPLRYGNGKFSVSFNLYVVTYNKKTRNLHYALTSTYRVTFEFHDNNFVFQKVESFGV